MFVMRACMDEHSFRWISRLAEYLQAGDPGSHQSTVGLLNTVGALVVIAPELHVCGRIVRARSGPLIGQDIRVSDVMPGIES